jgi:hypothetical protein
MILLKYPMNYFEFNARTYEFGNEWRKPCVPDVNKSDA